MNERPRVGISRCLLGINVRYDGGHKLEPFLVDVLGREVEWVDVCPELEAGMGVPREPVQLVASRGADGRLGVRMVGVRSGTEWTRRMAASTEARLDTIATMRLSGFVLKARSPSCGVRDVPVYGAVDVGAPVVTSGRGLFAEALTAVFPGLPVEDEEGLREAGALEDFLGRVRAFQARRDGGR